MQTGIAIQGMGLELANLTSQIELNKSQAEKNRAEAEKTAGGTNYKHIKSYIKKYEIDISHFDQYYNNGNRDNNLKIDISDILKENSSYSRTELKKRLYNEGLLKRECCLCGQDENWNGMKISLILDHINGVYNDNRLENLRIVCPNCNAGLDTFSGRKIIVTGKQIGRAHV